MEELIDNFYSVFQCAGNATPSNRLRSEIAGLYANMGIINGCMPHYDLEVQNRAIDSIGNLLGVINAKQAAIDAMSKPKRRVKR